MLRGCSRQLLGVSGSYGVVGDAAAPGGGGGGTGPVVQPANVSACRATTTARWAARRTGQPDCDQAQLTLDAKDKVWKGTYTLPAGEHAYKAAINKTWDENYGAGGVAERRQHLVHRTGHTGHLLLRARRHYVTSDAQGRSSRCPGRSRPSWAVRPTGIPACMRPWLTDPDGDGTYTWSTSEIPAGSYEVKVAHGLSWDENYGAGGAPNGQHPVAVPADGLVVTFSYVWRPTVLTVTTAKPGAQPDLSQAKAHWVDRDLLAVPAGRPRRSGTAGGCTGRTTGSLKVDAERHRRFLGCPALRPAGCRHGAGEVPALRGTRRSGSTTRDARKILTGQLGLAQYDDAGRLLDATGVQIPGVLDDVYGDATGARTA